MEEYSRRIELSIKRNKSIGLFQMVFGCLGTLFLLMILMMAAAFRGSRVFNAMPVLGILLLCILWRRGSRRRKMAKLADSYWLRLQTDPARSLDNLAQGLGHSSLKVRHNMQKMLKLGLFPDACLNGSLLILPPGVERIRTIESAPASRNLQAPAVPVRNTICPGCGATTSGQTNECEYCGSPL